MGQDPHRDCKTDLRDHNVIHEIGPKKKKFCLKNVLFWYLRNRHTEVNILGTNYSNDVCFHFVAVNSAYILYIYSLCFKQTSSYKVFPEHF